MSNRTTEKRSNTGVETRKSVLRPLSMALLASVSLSACSATPDWANPVNWYDSALGRNDGLPDEPLPEGTDEPFPTLSSVPPRPNPSLSPDEREEIAQGLIADRGRVAYTGEGLRGGTEPSASPPPPPAPPPLTYRPAAGQPATQNNEEEQNNAPAAQTPGNQSFLSPGFGPSSVANRQFSEFQFLPRVSTKIQQKNHELVVRLATAEFEPGLRRQLGQLVMAPGYIGAPVGGPLIPLDEGRSPILEKMASNDADAVFVNLGALPSSSGQSGLDVTGQPPVTIRFTGNGLQIDREGRRDIQSVAGAFNSGNAGMLRVVGHSSSRTREMSVEEHMLTNFESSLRRAEKVAKALISGGVSADKVIVEAVSDSQPIYYEAMPSGEALNRRVEIFIQ